jgi:hypothetical protein
MTHETRPVQVWADVDIGIADTVAYLNTIPGVRTYASCQGTIGEGGPCPYRAQVMVSCETRWARERLEEEFDITIPGDCDGSWFYVHPRDTNLSSVFDKWVLHVPAKWED